MTTPTRPPKRKPSDCVVCAALGHICSRCLWKRKRGDAKPTARKRKPAPIISQRLSLLAQATARLTKARRLVAQWRRLESDAQHNLGAAIACASRATLIERIRTLRRCTSQLAGILKP